MIKANKTGFLPAIAGLFSVVLVLSNTLDTKIFELWGLQLPAGIILFPLSYVFGDILTEVYGFRESRKVIWTGFACLLVAVLSYEIAIALPPAGFWKNQESFAAILGHVPRLALASLCAYLVGEFCNSIVLAKLKVFASGKQMWARFVASTVVGQFFDTGIFILIAFVGVLPNAALPSIFISAWLFKVLWEIIALPVSLPLAAWLKKAEAVDVYDRDISFNPFKG